MYKKNNMKNIKTFKEIDKENLDKLPKGRSLTNTNIAVEIEVIDYAIDDAIAAMVPE